MNSSDPNPGGPPADDQFSDAWDRYARRALDAGERWPGDDWGDPTVWRAWFARLFEPFGVASWTRAVEIGQGTGKYTRLVLDAGPAEVLACDVSREFLDLCAARLGNATAAGRLHLAQIASTDPLALCNAVAARGWQQVDAVFSIDALVHVPFTQIVGYLLQASAVLRPDGLVILSFAHGTTEAGLHKMVQDVPRVIRGGGSPTTGCFHWISPELIRNTATAIGYAIEICDADPLHQRDGHFVARLADPERARVARDFAWIER